MCLCKLIRDLLKWLEKNLPYASILSAVAIIAVIAQLHQSGVYKKYDNFLYFNKVYDEWYDDMPEKISDNEQTRFSDLDGAGKAWVRRYFNLYSQEFYFYRAGMIPKEMWEGLVHGCKDGKAKATLAAFRNLKRYPALLQGYVCWKKEDGAFGFPEKFMSMLDMDLRKCGIDITDEKKCD